MEKMTSKVKIIDTTNSFIGLKYINSNTRSRMKRDDFMRDYKNGMFDVVNPNLLETE